jgi:hypothetical protein
MLPTKFYLPSAINTPSVTAGLKCPPDTSPIIQILPKIVRPIAKAYKCPPSSALVLIAYSKLAVPIASKSKTYPMFSFPPLTSIIKISIKII